MVTVILTHEVKNYSEWKKVFDADAANRSTNGVKITGVYTSMNNPNLVTVTSEFASPEAVNGFMQNPELKAAMEKGGVMGEPEVKILNKVQ